MNECDRSYISTQRNKGDGDDYGCISMHSSRYHHHCSFPFVKFSKRAVGAAENPTLNQSYIYRSFPAVRGGCEINDIRCVCDAFSRVPPPPVDDSSISLDACLRRRPQGDHGALYTEVTDVQLDEEDGE